MVTNITNNKNKRGLDPQQQQELNEFIKSSVADGSYFKDARSWFTLNYISPLSQRSLLLLVSISGIIITYMIYVMITALLPLKHTIPVVIEAKDTAIYAPVIKSIESKKTDESIDEVVARYLVNNYVKEREEHDYRDGDVAVYNLKLNKIMNNSSASVFRDFKKYIDPNNKESPINDFGKNIFTIIRIRSTSFIAYNEVDILDVEGGKKQVPTKARVVFDRIATYNDQSDVETKVVDVSFNFSGVGKDNKAGRGFLPLDFVVTDYTYTK